MKRLAICSMVCGAGALVLSAAAASGDQPVTALRINADVSRALARQCRYSASIHGTVLPAGNGASNGSTGAEPVNPHIDVQATLNCPHLEAVTIDDSFMAKGPLTHDQLVQALERRGTIMTGTSNGEPGSNGRCVYAPELALQGSDLTLVNVDVSCKR